MNVFKRVMIFTTFFGCCIAIALLAASLGTNYWLSATAIQIKDGQIRKNSEGAVNFGLFKGKKVLNVGLGERVHVIKVTDSGHFLNKGLWIATIVFLCLGMLLAIVGALFAVINTATTPVDALAGIPGLYVWNIFAVIFDVVAVGCWSAEFSQYLSSNILEANAEDGWTTEGKETLGYSFWLVVGAIFVHVVNCWIIFIGTYERKRKAQVELPDAKAGNIMLY